jgi:hypothetical protein
MQPGKVNFKTPQGSTFTRTIVYKVDSSAVNLTGYTARMQVRKSVNDSSILLSLATSTGEIVITGGTGTITLTVAASVMAALAAGSWVYDLEITSGGGIVSRLIEGKFIVTPEVTR